MTTTSVLLAAFLVFVVASLLGRLIVTLRGRNREKYRYHRDKFFQLAQRLVHSSEAPFEVAILLSYLGRGLDHSLVPVYLAFALIYRGPAKTDPEIQRLLHRLQDAPKPVVKLFAQACFHAMHAVSFRSLMLGPIIRWSMPKVQKKRDGMRPDFLSRVIQHSERHTSNGDHDPLGRALRHVA